MQVLPNCDRCGRFTAHAVEEYDPYQPDPWNGPRTTLLCERCATPVLASTAEEDN